MSNEIKSIDLMHLRNDAHFQFHSDTAELITEANPDSMKIKPLFDVYLPAIAQEDEALKKIVKSEFTEEIQVADKARDRTYSSVTAIIRTTLKHHNPDVVKAAKRLKIVTDTYGNINQKSLEEQTSAVYNILQEFQGKYADDIELIRITEMVDELERANNALHELMQKRLDETAHKNPVTMKDAREVTDAAYLAIRKRINAAVEIEGPDNYAEFITILNATIDRYKLLLAKSHGKKHDDPKDGE